MRFLIGEDAKEASMYLQFAAEFARNSKCLRKRCGSVIVNKDKIIGSGYNSPPGDVCIERCFKDNLPADFKSDRTCCMHAEQRAISSALSNFSGLLQGSRLYFMRIDDKGKMVHAGQPYCTICSKATLDAGIAEFVLWHPEGIAVYDTKEYNNLSFAFRKQS